MNHGMVKAPRTFAEAGMKILEARCTTPPMSRTAL